MENDFCNDDFYNIDERWLAAYFEKDWFDLVLAQSRDPAIFKFPRFDPCLIYCRYHEEFISFIQTAAQKIGLSPRSLFEVGASLGRSFYEVCKRMPSIETATLVEPSQRFAAGFESLFRAGVATFPVHAGNYGSLTEIELDTHPILSVCSQVRKELLALPYESLKLETTYDMVICSNVIDQCKNPKELIRLLKSRTKPAGILALSCTYQWSEKHLSPDEERIADLREIFDQHWELLGETNLEYKFRKNERFWNSCLSEVLVYRRKPV